MKCIFLLFFMCCFLPCFSGAAMIKGKLILTSRMKLKVEEDKNSLQIEENICGFSAPKSKRDPISGMLKRSLQKRIIGGSTTLPQEHPWMTFIYEKKRGKVKGFVCGGSVISNQWILTAAHCLEQPFSPEVYGIAIGKYFMHDEMKSETTRDVSGIFLHPNYTNVPLSNDIALIKLNKPINYNRNQRPVCLPRYGFPIDSDESPTFAGRRCIAIGWGETATRTKSKVLMQVGVNILPRALCESMTKFPSALAYQGMPVRKGDRVFCAGGVKQQDTCKGDSGGPLLCPHDDGRFYLHGITSYGSKPCGMKNKPGVYTKVSDFTKWIKKVQRLNMKA